MTNPLTAIFQKRPEDVTAADIDTARLIGRGAGAGLRQRLDRAGFFFFHKEVRPHELVENILAGFREEAAQRRATNEQEEP